MRRYLRSWALCCLCSFLHTKAQALSHTEPDAPVYAVCDSSADADAVELSAHTVEAATDADPDIIGVLQIRLHGAEDPPWRELNIWRGRTPREPKIIDAILYNGEPSLQLRLELLGDVVDEFLVVEAATTFSGLAKPFLYTDRHASVLEPYRHKLTVMIVDSFPEPSEDDLKRLQSRYWTSEDSVLSWFREQYQRDLIAPYVADKYKDQPFVLLVCDADEIPHPHVVQHMRRSPELYRTLETPTALQMSMFFYNFKWLRDHPWMSAFAVNDQGLRAIHGQLSVTRQHPSSTYLQQAGI
eukprot:TRINITY_DN3307_c0_g1_i3.p1 TRINITY_DN3307_c0_g1~~TRINITY_DN3307_c0_g1_i3.p1  ORF type:complete len:298 (+),score=24.95 TRINITY_DN3307_c0_g1_i3:153-1046(+)